MNVFTGSDRLLCSPPQLRDHTEILLRLNDPGNDPTVNLLEDDGLCSKFAIAACPLDRIDGAIRSVPPGAKLGTIAGYASQRIAMSARSTRK